MQGTIVQYVILRGEPIAGRYNNKYMDNQALNGLMRKDLYDSTYDEIMYTMYHYPISRLHYKSINDEWKINNYLFWLDTSGQPNYDARNLRDKVNAEYIRQSEIKTDMQYYYKMQTERRHKEKQGRSQHKCYPWRDDARYIQRARAAYAMEAEEEYRRFVKAKDKSFKTDITLLDGKITLGTAIGISGKQNKEEIMKR